MITGRIVHLADAPIGPIQRCADCGEILTDHSDFTNKLVISTTGSSELRFWPTNAFVMIDGNYSCVVTDDEDMFYRCSLQES